MDMPEKMDLRSLDVAEDKRRQLAQLFPEVVTEVREEGGGTTNGHESTRMGRYRYAVDFEKLKGVLGEFSEILENQRERYGMTWPGKNECLKIIQQPSIATLKPCREESINFDETENLFIEGDNLEALKLLQKAYYGKVKMIYIDPPYNTGKEFIYPDKYSENLDTYLSYTGQVDAEGRKFSTNTEAEGRFHSKWLNMMLPRLYLARNLLRDDGVIFISIDDHEVKNLRELCDEVFGEENFVAQLIWEGANKNDARQIGIAHEYVIVYSRSRIDLPVGWRIAKEGTEPVFKEVERLKKKHGKDFKAASEELASWFRSMKATTSFSLRRFRNIDERGAYKEDDPTAPGGRHFNLMNPRTGELIPLRKNRGWGFDQETFNRLVEEGRITFVTPTSVMVRRYLHETDSVTPPSVFYQPARSASERLGKLLGQNIFDYPKDEFIIAKFLEMSTGASSQPDIILDFFSGSCTTAHAVLELNKQDGGNRKFIMVQLPEPCDEKSEAYKAGYKTIADIGKERIRRVIKKRSEDEPRIDTNKHESKQEQLFSDPEISVHSCPFVVQSPPGFRVFKLALSNFRLWDGSQPGEDPEKIAKQLELHEQHIDPNATPEDLLYELLLKAGFPLTTKVEPLYLFDGKLQNEEPRIDTNQHESKDKNIGVHSCSLVVPSVFSIAEGALLICLQDEITKELIKAMADADPLQVICLDSGFKNNDQLKANAVQTFKARNKSAETATVFRTV